MSEKGLTLSKCLHKARSRCGSHALIYLVCRGSFWSGPESSDKNNIGAKILVAIWALQPVTCASGGHEHTLQYPTAVMRCYVRKASRDTAGLVCFLCAVWIPITRWQQSSYHCLFHHLTTMCHQRMGFLSG